MISDERAERRNLVNETLEAPRRVVPRFARKPFNGGGRVKWDDGDAGGRDGGGWKVRELEAFPNATMVTSSMEGLCWSRTAPKGGVPTWLGPDVAGIQEGP